MSKTILLNQSDWHFTKENPGIPTAVMGEAVALPHTWNAVDGQDGGNDYYRGTCWYTLALAKPTIPAGGKAVLQLDGAAMTAAIYLNGEKLAEHKGGYSTFRVDLTDHLKDENLLAISVDNRDNDTDVPPVLLLIRECDDLKALGELWTWNRLLRRPVMIADIAAWDADHVAGPSVGGNIYRGMLALQILQQDKLI